MNGQAITAPAHIVLARSWIGTPWMHRGRSPGRHLDCLGLVVCALQRTGIQVKDKRHYARDPEKDQLRQELQARFGSPLPPAEARVGDIAVFTGDVYPHHIGFVADYAVVPGLLSLIHATNEPTVMAVSECRLSGSPYWERRWIEAYRVGG